MTDMEILKEKVARCCHFLQREGLIAAGGHVSARIPGTNRILIHPMTISRAAVEPRHIITVDEDRNLIEGEFEPPKETFIHTCIYQARPDVFSVAHLHSHYATLMSLTAKNRQTIFNRSGIFAGDVPVYHHSWNIGNREKGDELALVLGQASAVLLKGHGAVTVADSIESIFMVSAHLEEGARMSFELRLLGETATVTEREDEKTLADRAMTVAKYWSFQESLSKKVRD